MMKRIFAILSGLALSGLAACYNPELAPAPFLCGQGGKCPEGYSCYGGICMDSKPECMMEGFIFDGGQDADLEPNNRPDYSVTLPCGDPEDLSYTPCSCPPLVTSTDFRRKTYENGFPGLAICPEGDLDYYKFYLFANEVLRLTLVYEYHPGRNLDLETGRFVDEDYQILGEAKSTNDNETLDIEADFNGWYYILVKPSRSQNEYDQNGNITRAADLNEYVLTFELNPAGCNSNGTCDPYETHTSCPNDCTAQFHCGNKVCEQGETGPDACPEDCVCGNGTCDLQVGENSTGCPEDCPPGCS